MIILYLYKLMYRVYCWHFCLIWGSFSWFGLSVPGEGKLTATANNDILDNSTLLSLWQRFGEDPFLFPHDKAIIHKDRSIKSGCERTCLAYTELNSATSSTVGMNRNSDCDPDVMTQHQWPTSLNGRKSQWKAWNQKRWAWWSSRFMSMVLDQHSMQ